MKAECAFPLVSIPLKTVHIILERIHLLPLSADFRYGKFTFQSTVIFATWMKHSHPNYSYIQNMMAPIIFKTEKSSCQNLSRRNTPYLFFSFWTTLPRGILRHQLYKPPQQHWHPQKKNVLTARYILKYVIKCYMTSRQCKLHFKLLYLHTI